MMLPSIWQKLERRKVCRKYAEQLLICKTKDIFKLFSVWIGEALDYVVTLMKKEGDTPLGQLQGYTQSYNDGARRFANYFFQSFCLNMIKFLTCRVDGLSIVHISFKVYC